MAIGIQSCIFLIFLVNSLQKTDGSFIKSFVTSSSIRVDVRDTNTTSLAEISYSKVNSSSLVHVVRFIETHTMYKITCLKPDTTYTLTITTLVQNRSEDETIALTTDHKRGGDDDDHPVFFFLTIGISALCGVLLLVVCIMVCARCCSCCCSSKTERSNKHVENKSSIMQRMRKRRGQEQSIVQVPCKDISDYTNSIPGWKAS
ncbi:uncharacterized protein LOC117124570 [Anneissia japonica]|uniref:uncharacterized protein LOC117124570 n=1 Tax=Anneissia japonica TaxID=1529436 RepID=UPI001425725C|nr:uncharacterized protein LOC117124570 [Anneissia japonica]